MRTHFFLCALVLVLLSGCYNVKRPEKPKNLLTEDQMVSVIMDLAVLSAAKGVNKKRIEEKGIIPDQYIYTKNNIDSLSFAESNLYYGFDIETYNHIYARVKDSLTKHKKYYEDKEEREKEEKNSLDSLRRSKMKEGSKPVKDTLVIKKGLVSPNRKVN